MQVKNHHVAVICSDIQRSERWWCDVLGLRVARREYREARRSWKVDLENDSGVRIELFTFEGAPARPSYPEAMGLRHVAFEIGDVEAMVRRVESLGVKVEPVRVDAATGKRFTFFADPDGLPVEIYEA